MKGRTIKLLQDAVDRAGASTTGHGDVELVNVAVNRSDHGWDSFRHSEDGVYRAGFSADLLRCLCLWEMLLILACLVRTDNGNIDFMYSSSFD